MLLEFEVRRPRDVALYQRRFRLIAAMLYTGLALLVFVWAWRNEWLDAYDALLWLVAFATIEMNVLNMSRAKAAA